MGLVLYSFLFCLSDAFAKIDGGFPTLGISRGFSETVQFEGLKHASIADSRVARVRALPPNGVLVTGLKPGRTLLRLWSRAGKTRVLEVRVSDQREEDFEQDDSLGMVEVTFPIVEIRRGLAGIHGLGLPGFLQAEGTGSIALAGSPDTFGTGAGGVFRWATSKATVASLLETEGARVVSEPRLLVRLGDQLHYSLGGELPVPGSSDVGGRLAQRVEWKSYGLELKAAPTSTDLVHFHCKLEFSFSEPASGASVFGVPPILRRSFSTMVTVLDDEALVVSSLNVSELQKL